jgi:hypothetical protein
MKMPPFSVNPVKPGSDNKKPAPGKAPLRRFCLVHHFLGGVSACQPAKKLPLNSPKKTCKFKY